MAIRDTIVSALDKGKMDAILFLNDKAGSKEQVD